MRDFACRGGAGNGYGNVFRNGSIALVCAMLVAGCAGAPLEKPTNVMTEQGALLMQAAPDPESKLALAKMLCSKQGFEEGSRPFARCVMELHGRDRALSRARAEQQRKEKVVRIPLCFGPGDFTLARCIEI